MPQSYARIILHTTFSTKYRNPYLQPEIEKGLYYVFRSEFRKHGCELIRLGIVPDHVHIVHTLSRTTTLAKVIQAVKGVSSGWIKGQGAPYVNFAWQDGYGAHSADYRRLEKLFNYVDTQKEHHGHPAHAISFEEEYLQLLSSYGFRKELDHRFLFPNSPEQNPGVSKFAKG